MFGAFNLRADVILKDFKLDFDAFCQHLKVEGHLRDWRLWERAYHAGYDTRFPEVRIIIEMRFAHYQASIDAWDFVVAASETTRTLHRRMNSKICDAHFVLCNET